MQYKIIMQLETACYFIHFRIPIKFINRNKKKYDYYYYYIINIVYQLDFSRPNYFLLK